jgi:thiamine monophosphate synthase
VCAITPVPVLGIGGMSLERLGAVGKAGAAGFAAISLFADCDVDALTSIVGRSTRAFDTSHDVP